MSVSYGAFGTISHGTTSCTPAYPSPTAGQGLFMLVSFTETSNTVPVTPSGWTLLGSASGGAGSFGLDTGPRGVAWYKRDTDATGSEGTGTVTVTAGGSGATRAISAIIISVTKTLAAWEASFCSGADATDGTAYSATMTPPTQAVSGDLALIGTTWRPDNVTQSSPSMAWTGSATTVTGRTAGGNTNDNDHRIIFQTYTPTGTTSGNAVFTQTASASTASGITAMVLIRDAAAANFEGWGIPL